MKEKRKKRLQKQHGQSKRENVIDNKSSKSLSLKWGRKSVVKECEELRQKIQALF
jgi:hypothetical protein